MATALYRLRCFLRRAQMLLLFLGIAYLMAGSILLLQRSSLTLKTAQPPGDASLPSLMALPAPPTAVRASPGLGLRARSRWAATQGVLGGGGGIKTGRHWPTSRHLGVQHLHHRWFHGLMPDTQEQRGPLQRNKRHKGTYMGCFMHDANERALGGTMLYDLRKMTSSLCQDTCSESGYRFAGLEYGAECHCGNRISSPQAQEEDCSLGCRGERGERGAPCGGVGRLSIYKVEEQLPGQRKFRNVRYSGCFKLPKNITIVFPVYSLQSNSTSQSCIETCTDKELPLAVLRNPHCYCAWASSLFRLNQRLPPDQPCLETNGTAHTVASTSRAGPYYYQVYQTPVLDSRCKERMFLPERSTSLVALSSFPGAGNTWVRHLIELVTGYYTGSFYFDGTLYNRGFKGEKDYWKSGRSICVKTHESGQREIEMFDSAILLIRNPYRSLMAEFNRKCAGHLGYATDKQWRSKEWPEFVDSYAPWWASHALSWLQFGRRLLVVHYEDLQRALFPQLRLLTSFLNATITEERLMCAQSNQDGHFKRSGRAQRPSFDPFTAELRSTIDSYIHTVDQALRDRNYSGLPHDYIPR
ncbi:WSC domain-containing protein 1 [Oncorhynchus kisutch]|uniref:WSC domain containing 1 n=1 Tax=Oncorhynchus kisutch TaxID=8019 RepID=A0A8C7I9W6_ONCKI|nr:WSC domain-containing protein 1 [Oncorhynchus kisutch]